MDRYNNLKDLPVICIDDGSIFGKVSDLVVNENLKIAAWLIETKRKTLILEPDTILKIGQNAVIIENKKKIKPMDIKNREVTKISNIIGCMVFTRKGENAGIITDVLFETNTGMLDGFEISDGILNDFVFGRNIIPVSGKIEFCKNYILIEQSIYDDMVNTGKGIKNILNVERSWKL